MRIFRKEKFENGHRNIYFCGMKIASYKKKKRYRNTKMNHMPNFGEHIDGYVRNGVNFPHPVGIVISKHAVIGKNCTIYQNVTIGTKYESKTTEQDYPKIGNNVTVYAGAVIIGSVTIGDNAVIGANSVVLHNVPKGASVAGIPARVIKKVKK